MHLPRTLSGCARLSLALLVALAHLSATAAVRAGEVMPPDLAARRAEQAALEAEVQATRGLVGPRVNALLPLVPAFSHHLRAVHQVPLDPGERAALLGQGVGALATEKAAVFQAAAPSFAAMKQALAAYFAAYDAYQTAEIHLRTYATILGALERREALEPHLKARQRAKLGAALATLEAKEREYRELVADPAGKFYDRPELAKEVYFLAADVGELLLGLERKAGLAPKLPWGQRLGGALHGLAQKARALKIQAVSLPAMARLFTHVFLRPFWNREHDAARTNDLIRFFSRSYRWAAGMTLRVQGGEGIPADAPVVFALSHRATIEDAMTMAAVVPGTYSFMWGARAMPSWLKKKLVADPSVIAVGGENPDGSPVDAVAEAIEALRQGRNLALFPEGNVPTPQGETRPLRSGIDVITEQVSDQPVYIVPITIDDSALDWDAENLEPSKERKLTLDVTVGAAIDPLRLKSVPGADRQLLLDVIRGIYHRNLFRADVSLDPPECAQECRLETLGVVPAPSQEAFGVLHDG